MINWFCSIPENIGWIIVGAIGMLCAVMLIKFGRIIVKMIKYRIEENEFWKVHHCDKGEE